MSRNIILYHIIALLMGYILDLLIGDPYNMPHPIRAIGRYIAYLDKKLFPKVERAANKEFKRGILLCIIVVLTVFLVISFIIILAYSLNIVLGIITESIFTCYILAAKSLKDESLKVYHEVKTGNLSSARKAVSMIVGRDTDKLEMQGVIKATVETVAENTSDGVIAPLLYLSIGGPILGMIYKAVNTMDSMVGYHNDRYEYFGRAAAKLDDFMNYIPSRISAVLMIFASAIAGEEYSYKNALRIFKRDRYNHKSPNSAQTESVCAGALRIQLAGNAYYFGKLVEKAYIGDPIKYIDVEDIRKACKLMFLTEFLAMILMLGINYIVYLLL